MTYLSDVQAYARLCRPQNASGSIVTYCIGYFLATRTLGADFFIGIAILLLLHSFATVQNDIADFDIDKANNRKSALQEKKISLHNARLLVWALAFSALIFALASPHRVFHVTCIVSLIIIAGIYNSNPVRGSRRPVASIVLMGLCYGAFPFGYGYLVAGGNLANRYFFILIFLWLLARIATSILKDYKDAAGDARFHKKTFYLRYGRTATAWTSITVSSLAYGGLLVILLKLKGSGIIFLVLLVLTVVLAVRSIFIRLRLIKTRNEDELNVTFHRSVLSHNQFEAAVLACLIFSSR